MTGRWTVDAVDSMWRETGRRWHGLGVRGVRVVDGTIARTGRHGRTSLRRWASCAMVKIPCTGMRMVGGVSAVSR